ITLSATVSLCANPIWQFGTEEQKEKFLVPLVEGTKLGAFGLTEPNAGTDASGQQTVAVKNDDGTYTLNGSKIFITNGGHADIYIVFA
ncbi:acyl-CoA dehydrogenase family protein, partial [Phascolarctobacterium faecium]